VRDLHAFAFRYCQAQRSNAKTTAVLEKAFAHLGDTPKSVLVTRYLYEVLFDHEFYYDTDQDFKDRLRRDTAGLGEGATAEASSTLCAQFRGEPRTSATACGRASNGLEEVPDPLRSLHRIRWINTSHQLHHTRGHAQQTL
jgi:hypothetical protein